MIYPELDDFWRLYGSIFIGGKEVRGQKLGNVGLNVDEKKRNEEAPRMGLKALGGSAGRAQCSFF